MCKERVNKQKRESKYTTGEKESGSSRWSRYEGKRTTVSHLEPGVRRAVKP